MKTTGLSQILQTSTKKYYKGHTDFGIALITFVKLDDAATGQSTNLASCS